MDKVVKDNKSTAQGVSEPPGPVGITSGLLGSTRRSSSYWKNGGGEVEPQASPRTVMATGVKTSGRRLAAGKEKPKMVSDVRISDNVTISVVSRNKGDEEGDPFRPSSKVLRSPTSGGRPDVEVVEGSEGSIGMRDSDLSTPVMTRGMAYAKQLAGGVVEKNVRAKLASSIRPVEAEDSAREDTMTSDVDDEDVPITRAELGGLTQALTGVVQILSALMRKFRMDKDKGEEIRQAGNLVKGVLSSLEQCERCKERRRKRRVEPAGGVVNRVTMASDGGYPKRKGTSPAELTMMEERKRPRKGEVSYAEACGSVASRIRMEEDYSDDSEGWKKVERRKRERRAPLTEEVPKVRPTDRREVAREDRGAFRDRRRREALLIKVAEGTEWIQVYRRLMAVRSTLEGATGVRRTRAGHILIEFDRTVSVHEAAARLRVALSDDMEVAALVNRATVQIRNIDPLTSKEELVEEMRVQWGIKDSVSVEVKSLKMAP